MKAARPSIAGLILIPLFLLAVGTATYYYLQYRSALQANPTNELQGITTRLSGFMELPEESPSLVTITDTEKISNPGLQAKAQSGDKLLLFPNAKRAFLYRPSSARLIDVFILDTTEQAATAPAT